MRPQHEAANAPTPVLHNTGGGCRMRIERVVQPVSGRVLVFNLAHALLVRRELEGPMHWRKLSPKAAAQLAQERWKRDVRHCLCDIHMLDIEPESLPVFLHQQRGAILGWTPTWEEAGLSKEHLLCTDIALTVSVLARRVGDLLLLARPPEPTWERLFGPLFALDDERIAGVRVEPIAS